MANLIRTTLTDPQVREIALFFDGQEIPRGVQHADEDLTELDMNSET